MIGIKYKDPLGRVAIKDRDGKRRIATICRANGLFAIVWRKQSLLSYVSDFKHLRRYFEWICYPHITNWIIYANAWDKKDLKKLLSIFIKYKIRFTIKYNK